jgi:nucleotide-binding universal stress UspA family protein
MFKKILVPIDLAEVKLAELGIGLATEFASWTAGEVRLIHVVSDLPYGLGVLLPPDISRNVESSARSSLREIAAKADIPVGRASYIVRTGVPYHEVLAEAWAWSADLVIVGSHDLSKGRYLLGSNAEKIVRHAACSVLVVRAHADREGTYWLVPPITS